MVRGFAEFWRQLGRSFLDQTEVEQYNALKHGFRVRQGGFDLSMAIDDPQTGEAGPAHHLGGSVYGASFFTVHRRRDDGPKFHLTSRHTVINWSVDRILLQFQLVAWSISNAVSALRIHDGTPASQCRFECPEELDDFQRPSRAGPGSMSATFDLDPESVSIPPVTQDELLARLSAAHLDGTASGTT